MKKIDTINALVASDKLSNILIHKFGENLKFEIVCYEDNKFIEVKSENLEIIKFLKTYHD